MPFSHCSNGWLVSQSFDYSAGWLANQSVTIHSVRVMVLNTPAQPSTVKAADDIWKCALNLKNKQNHAWSNFLSVRRSMMPLTFLQKQTDNGESTASSREQRNISLCFVSASFSFFFVCLFSYFQKKLMILMPLDTLYPNHWEFDQYQYFNLT